MNAGTAIARRGRSDGMLGVTCWCERTVVYVDPSVVLAGRTAPCDRKPCRQMARRAS